MSSRLKMAAAKITNSESSDLLRKSSRIVSTPESARKTWSEVVKAADEKQAERILVLDVSESLSICGNFVLMSAHNTRLVQTLAEFIEEKLIHAGLGGPIHIEGIDDYKWVVLDYGDVVVHIFLEETRRYYEIERLWADSPRPSIEDLLLSAG